MGIPPSAIVCRGGTAVQRQQIQHSFLGNGFHLPSIIAILCFLPQLLAFKVPLPLALADEQALKSRLQGTVWEPGRIQTFPGLLSAQQVVDEMQHIFQDFALEKETWNLTQVRLEACQLCKMQTYTAWCRQKGLDWEVLAPHPVTSRDRSFVYAGLSGQRYPSSSSRGLDHLVPPGLGKDAHIQATRDLPTPFHPRVWPEPDVAFVVDALLVWQVHLIQVAAEMRRTLASIALALQPLEQALDSHRCFSSKQVARTKRPGFIAAMSVLLRWPDRTQPCNLIRGYRIVGDMHTSGLFRDVAPKETASFDDWLGHSAEEAIQRIINSGPPRHFQDIYDITLQEQQREFCGPWYTKLEMDDQFGKGAWRPLERFLIQQPDGKQRCIDNARKTGHNQVTCLWETITTVAPDVVASMARMVADAFQLTTSPWETHPWLTVRIGTDDLPDAYRGLPVCQDQLCFSSVAVFIPKIGWRFTPLYGLAYGLESAVVNFNRFPQLGVAMARTTCLAFCAAYFDDELGVEFIHQSNVSQLGLRHCFKLMGAPPQDSKAFEASFDRHFLGTSVHTAEFALSGTIRFQPKLQTTSKIIGRLDQALALKHLDRDTAGKLRGDLNWMFSHCAGNIGKFAGPLLNTIQQEAPAILSKSQQDTLHTLQHIVLFSSPLDVRVIGRPPVTTRIYSDASFEDQELRLGWNQRPFGGTCVVPQECLDGWIPRRQQIFPGETLCGLAVPWFHFDRLRHQDLLWFIDNEGACSALIRGASRQPDVHLIAQFSSLLLHSLGSRSWYEWVDTESNCSDGLSRDGLRDAWTAAQNWDICEYPFPEALLPDTFLEVFKSHLGLVDSGCINR